MRKPAVYVALSAILGLNSLLLVAADQPAGVIRCSGAFQIDGSTVSSSATVFNGSRVESGDGICTIRRSQGTVIRLQKRSGADIADSGVTLRHGTIQVRGNQILHIAGATAFIKPSGSDAVMNAELEGNLLSVNMAGGNAALTGAQSELFARLHRGTLMLFSLAPAEPSGLYLWVNGCLHAEDRVWLVNDRYIDHRVELAQDTVQKERQSVQAWGKLQSLPADSPQLVARLQVVQEKTDQQPCYAFTPVWDLNGGTFQISAGVRDTVVGAFAAELAAISALAANLPGQPAVAASLP